LIDFCLIAVVWDNYKAIVDARFTVVQETSIVNLGGLDVRSLHLIDYSQQPGFLWFGSVGT